MAIERIEEGQLRAEIAGRIKSRRNELNLSVAVVAQRSEVSISFMREMEAGTTTANVLVYIRLAQVLKCGLEFLLSGGSNPHEHEMLKVEMLEQISTHLEEMVEIAKDMRKWLWNRA